MLAPDDDAPLVERSRQGDADAFEELVLRHQRMIHALTYRMSGSAADAADLAQESFVRAWRQIGSFRGTARFRSWLYQITLNTCLNWAKRTSRRSRLNEEVADQFAAGGTPDAPLVETAARVNEALQRLDPALRAAVVLTVYEGMNHASAARVLGCAETTVSWRIFVARRKLKRWLQDLAPKKGSP